MLTYTCLNYYQKRLVELHSPSVLVPSLDLSVGQVQLGRQLHAVLHTQVLLPLEALLQRLQLVVGEGRACLPLLLARRRTGTRLLLALLRR